MSFDIGEQNHPNGIWDYVRQLNSVASNIHKFDHTFTTRSQFKITSGPQNQ